MKRLHWSRGCTSAHRDIASRRGSDGGQAAPIGDWVSDNPVLPVSCGSCSASTYTSSVDHCVLGMQRSPHPFRSESKPVTQEPSSQFLLAAPGISSRATRRTLSTFRRSRFCAYETCSVFRCPFVPYRVHYPLYIEESIGVSNFPIPYVCATGLELRFFDVA